MKEHKKQKFIEGMRATKWPIQEQVKVKFRLYDALDIGPFEYQPICPVYFLKKTIFSEWPKDKNNLVVPKAADDIKLIYDGKVLEDSKGLGQFGELPKGVIIIHASVHKTKKKINEAPNKGMCACSIM